MKRYDVIVIFSCFVTLSTTSNVLRPRGVSLQKASLYDPTKPFTCFDGSTSVPFNLVNDDYCDCLDGSDEPGTAACSNGSFHCNNIGHKPEDISSSFVNDGYCDCCDASDEYASTADCTNTCEVLGEAARVEERRMAEEQLHGYNIREQMAEEGAKLKNEKQARLAELEKEKERIEIEKTLKESAKDSAEAPEKEALAKYKDLEEDRKMEKEEKRLADERADAEAAFVELDVDQDGFITYQDLQSNMVFDTNKDGVVSEDEAMFYLHQEEDIDLEKFVTTTWVYVKAPYMYGKNVFTPPTEDGNLDTEEEERDTEIKDESSLEEMQERQEDDFSEDMEDDADDTSDDEYAEETDEEGEQEEEVAKVEPEETIEYDEETQRLVDAANSARKEFEDIDRELRDTVRDIKQISDGLERDLGPHDEFRALEGVCYEYTDREYTYKLCPFDHAVQKPVSGHGETRLGTWGHWAGPDDNKYSVMKYTGGQSCWNGPQRSAEVRLHCSIETKLTAAAEPNRCEYLFQMSTPAVCTQPDSVTLHQHTEL